jgi:hypothetical protein
LRQWTIREHGESGKSTMMAATSKLRWRRQRRIREGGNGGSVAMLATIAMLR